jgi:hypothetical protein
MIERTQHYFNWNHPTKIRLHLQSKKKANSFLGICTWQEQEFWDKFQRIEEKMENYK